MMNRAVLELALVGALAFAGTAAAAQNQMKPEGQERAQGSHMMMQGQQDDGMMDMMGGKDNGMMGAANLSEEQQQKLADLHAEQARQHFLLMQKMQAPRQRLQELMASEEPDVQAISQTYDKLADLRKKALISRIETRRQMQQVTGQGQQQASGQAQRPAMHQ